MKKEAINKAGLVAAVQKNLGKDATRKCAEDAVNAVIDAIKSTVKSGRAFSSSVSVLSLLLSARPAPA